MWKPACYRATLPWVGLALTAAVLLVGSCDEAARYRTLTFFFDGVPHPASESSGLGPVDPNGLQSAEVSPAGGWHVHPPVSDCTQCHGDRRRTAFSRQVQLVATVPKLCYKCHEAYAALEGWVHGPVATGECLLCHEPHRTKNESLLVKPSPDLCYQCHDPQAVHQIEGHADESYAHCNDCHEGHAGATKSLLKPAFLAKPAGHKYLSEVHRAQYEEALRRVRDDLALGKGLTAVFQRAAGYIEAGNLWPARACLETIGGNDALTDREKSTVAEVLGQVVAMSEARPVGQAKDGGEQTSPAAAQASLAASLRAMRDERSRRQTATADRYYSSIRQYHAARFTEAQAGFREVLADRSMPEPMRQMARDYLEKIDWLLKESPAPGPQPPR